MVSVDEMADALAELFADYTTEVNDKLRDATKTIARKGANAVRASARANVGGTGRYAAGWTYKAEDKRLSTSAVIYNKDRPGLAHLIEHGHVTRNGTGRTYDRTPAHVHIEPVEEQILKDYLNEVRMTL